MASAITVSGVQANAVNVTKSSAAKATKNPVAKNHNCSYVKPPTNLVELLQNLLCFTKSSANIDDKFFVDDEKLWELTGGQNFFRIYPLEPQSKGTYITHFPLGIDSPVGSDPASILPPSSSENSSTKSKFYSLGVDISKIRAPSELRIRVYHAGGMKLSFEDIEKIFGTDWKERLSPSVVEEPFNPPRAKATNPHGWQEIDYHFAVSPKLDAKISVDFNAGGAPGIIEIIVKETSHD